MRCLRECEDIVVNRMESSYMLHVPIFNKRKIGDDEGEHEYLKLHKNLQSFNPKKIVCTILRPILHLKQLSWWTYLYKDENQNHKGRETSSTMRTTIGGENNKTMKTMVTKDQLKAKAKSEGMNNTQKWQHGGTLNLSLFV